MATIQSNCSSVDGTQDCVLTRALNEFGRTINLTTTYGKNHPDARKALRETAMMMTKLLTNREKLTIGAINGAMTVDDKTINTAGTPQKSLERRLARLKITRLMIRIGITEEELSQLTGLLAACNATAFQNKLRESHMHHIMY